MVLTLVPRPSLWNFHGLSMVLILANGVILRFCMHLSFHPYSHGNKCINATFSKWKLHFRTSGYSLTNPVTSVFEKSFKFGRLAFGTLGCALSLNKHTHTSLGIVKRLPTKYSAVTAGWLVWKKTWFATEKNIVERRFSKSYQSFAWFFFWKWIAFACSIFQRHWPDKSGTKLPMATGCYQLLVVAAVC